MESNSRVEGKRAESNSSVEGKRTESNSSVKDKKTESNTSIKEYITPVFLEADRINWSNQEQYKNLQTKQVGEEGRSDAQAEEEAETDDEMVEYGVKVAYKTVRSAVCAYGARDWGLRSRMEYYRNSVARLRETNRKRGKWSVCWNSFTCLHHPVCPHIPFL